MPNNRVVLAGGSGFVGQALARYLTRNGFEVVVLTRSPQARDLVGSGLFWDGATPGDWAASFEDALAVVNLAGKSINSPRTQANRQEILRSRVDSVKVVAEAIRRCKRPPGVFVQTSAIGIYGDSGDRVCDESTPPGTGYLADTCKAWEGALENQPVAGVRQVILRLGVVLGSQGGMLPTVARLARWFLGGAAGSGRQYISWIHLADAVRIFDEAIQREDRRGVYIASSPQPVANGHFMTSLRQVLHRPWSPPVPAFAMRLGGWLMGIDVELALAGQRCIPRRLLGEGFAFEFPQLRAALEDLVDR